MHLRLDQHSFLPSFAIVDTAGQHDNKRAREVCANIEVYAALLVYVLLRFHAHLSLWGHSFTRLLAVTRWALWERLDLLALLKSYGTASGRFKVIGALNDAWLPGFTPAKT